MKVNLFNSRCQKRRSQKREMEILSIIHNFSILMVNVVNPSKHECSGAVHLVTTKMEDPGAKCALESKDTMVKVGSKVHF